MKTVNKYVVIMMSLVLTTSCGKPNVLTEFSETDSDEALYVEAKKKIDELEWQQAIDIIEDDMSSSYRGRSDVTETLASAYAGKCGLTFFDLLQGMSESPSSALFPYFMGLFKDQTLDTASCDEAIRLINTLGTVSTRTENQNLFMALLGIARLGTTLSSILDQEDHDGTADQTFNVCHDYTSGSPANMWPGAYYAAPFNLPSPPNTVDHYLSDDDVADVVTGLGLIFENIAALGAALGGDSTMTALEDALENCETANGGAGSCTITDADSVSSETKYIFRALMDDSGMGFGTCDMDAFAAYNPDANGDGTISAGELAASPPPTTLCCISSRLPGF